MTRVKEIETADKQPFKPIYCRNCHSKNTFDEVKGIMNESETKLLWHRWKCRICGATTIYPTENL